MLNRLFALVISLIFAVCGWNFDLNDTESYSMEELLTAAQEEVMEADEDSEAFDEESDEEENDEDISEVDEIESEDEEAEDESEDEEINA